MKLVGAWGCEACGKSFTSLSAFDMHREGDFGKTKALCTRHCLSTKDMQRKKMKKNERGAWSGPENPYWANRKAS